MKTLRLFGLLALIAAFCVLAAGAVGAQEEGGAAVAPISEDQVNDIAEKLYCPVCENITLDTCGTAACADWRYEIRLQLEQGYSETEIIADFVRRFGDRVVGTPHDPLLRALSLVTPWLMIAGALYLAFKLFGQRKAQPTEKASDEVVSHKPANAYRELLEQDLR